MDPYNLYIDIQMPLERLMTAFEHLRANIIGNFLRNKLMNACEIIEFDLHLNNRNTWQLMKWIYTEIDLARDDKVRWHYLEWIYSSLIETQSEIEEDGTPTNLKDIK